VTLVGEEQALSGLPICQQPSDMTRDEVLRPWRQKASIKVGNDEGCSTIRCVIPGLLADPIMCQGFLSSQLTDIRDGRRLLSDCGGC